MMILRSSDASPFGRKIKIAAKELGLYDRIEVVIADTRDMADPLMQQNPLGKVPALILEDGFVLYDSPVIAEYLDGLAGGGKLIPTHPAARFPVLVQQALCDGMLDAALLLVYEQRWRDLPMRSAAWEAHQHGKIERGLAALEEGFPGDGIHIGTISVACMLGYLDLRFEGSWRAKHPRLVGWLDGFSVRVPAFDETRPKG